MHKLGRRHGHGTYILPDGRKLEGEWVEGVLHGKGTATLSGGVTTPWEWVAGQPKTDIAMGGGSTFQPSS